MELHTFLRLDSNGWVFPTSATNQNSQLIVKFDVFGCCVVTNVRVMFIQFLGAPAWNPVSTGSISKDCLLRFGPSLGVFRSHPFLTSVLRAGFFVMGVFRVSVMHRVWPRCVLRFSVRFIVVRCIWHMMCCFVRRLYSSSSFVFAS